MKPKQKTSINLKGWADTFVITGAILIVLAFFGWIFSGDSVATELCMGILFIFASPVIRGLSVLVQNAEEQIEEREKVNMEDE